MVELHAKEAPDRVWELVAYGALFDRTSEGKISQRNFGGHEYPHLAQVGDRTGLEMIRTFQQKVVSLQQEDLLEYGDAEARIKVFAELTVTELLKDGDAISGAFGYYRETGSFALFEAPAVILATGGIGKSFKVTSNSWEYTGDGHALALRAGANLINMEFMQFQPTGMIWPPSVKGILVMESVRGDGGILTNSEGKRFMFDYVPDVFVDQYAKTEEEGDRWYDDQENNKRPPELLPRDEVARAINSEVKAGRGTEHGGVYLDVSTRLSAEVIKKKLPAMYAQFICWQMSTSPPPRSKWARPPTTSWAAWRSTRTPKGLRFRDCSPAVRSPDACTAPTGSGATPCPKCSSSAAVSGWARRPMSPGSSTNGPPPARRILRLQARPHSLLSTRRL